MKKLTILHNGGGWVTNIGNAFLDLGTMEFLRQACPNADIYLTSVLNRWISYHVKRGVMGRIVRKDVALDHVFNIQEHSNIHYISQSGAFLAQHWFDIHGDIFLKLKEKGIRLIIVGGGMTDSTYFKKDEVEKVRKFLKKVEPYVFISRDEMAFEYFADLAEHSYNGIDPAFFLSDHYKPLSITNYEYVVLNFDKSPEPSKEELGIDENEKIVRTHHSFWHNFSIREYPKMKRYYYDLENTLISEIPEDYLNVYANAKATYSDRVHACVASLTYGTPARLFSKSPRSLLFKQIGVDITSNLTKPDMDALEKEKQKQVKFLSEVISSG